MPLIPITSKTRDIILLDAPKKSLCRTILEARPQDPVTGNYLMWLPQEAYDAFVECEFHTHPHLLELYLSDAVLEQYNRSEA